MVVLADMCSGQSNMEYSVAGTFNHEAEINSSSYPGLRIVTVCVIGAAACQQPRVHGRFLAEHAHGAVPNKISRFRGFIYFILQGKALDADTAARPRARGGRVGGVWSKHRPSERKPRHLRRRELHGALGGSILIGLIASS